MAEPEEMLGLVALHLPEDGGSYSPATTPSQCRWRELYCTESNGAMNQVSRCSLKVVNDQQQPYPTNVSDFKNKRAHVLSVGNLHSGSSTQTRSIIVNCHRVFQRLEEMTLTSSKEWHHSL